MTLHKYRECDICHKKIEPEEFYYQLYLRQSGVVGIVSAKRDVCQKCVESKLNIKKPKSEKGKKNNG